MARVEQFQDKSSSVKITVDKESRRDDLFEHSANGVQHKGQGLVKTVHFTKTEKNDFVGVRVAACESTDVNTCVDARVVPFNGKRAELPVTRPDHEIVPSEGLTSYLFFYGQRKNGSSQMLGYAAVSYVGKELKIEIVDVPKLPALISQRQ